MDDNISGFFEPVTGYAQPDTGSFTLLHASEEGFFELYRGTRAGRFRVYKCLKPAWRDSLLHETMLKKEFEIGYSLRHANICETYAFVDLPRLGPCIEMEWVDGLSLADYLQQHGRPDRKTFRKWAGDLCDALTYLHSRQIVHRDLKPPNLMITHDGGSIKLIDFGLADRADSAVLKAPAGTRRYVAPEVEAGQPADARSDIYSLGMVLRELSRHPSRVISRCLQKDPDKRYPSAQAVKETLLSRRGLLFGLLSAVAGLGIAAFLLLPRHHSAPAGPTGTPVQDTVVVVLSEPAQNQPETKPQTAPPKTKKDDDLDQIFRQATDLFEEYL